MLISGIRYSVFDRMEKHFQKRISSLEIMADFVARFLERNKIKEDTSFKLNLMIEEIFTNMVKYGNGGTDEMSLCLTIKGSEIVVTMIDFDVAPFDITESPEVDTHMPLNERKPGGLGLHLVKTLADEVIYEHVDGNSIVTMKMKIEEQDV